MFVLISTASLITSHPPTRSVAEGIEHFKEGRHSEAFQCLNAARSYNMSGPNPLAVGEMMAYLRDLTAFDLLSQRKRFVRFMQMMDDAVLAHHADKAEAARKAKAGAQPKGPKKPTG